MGSVIFLSIARADGESYEGGFKYGRREGSGIYTFSDGASFVGVFHDDQPKGKGVCTLPGGRCFHGDYVLFEAYLRATRLRRGGKGKDAWIHHSWKESSDLLRNPPWHGFTAVFVSSYVWSAYSMLEHACMKIKC